MFKLCLITLLLFNELNRCLCFLIPQNKMSQLSLSRINSESATVNTDKPVQKNRYGVVKNKVGYPKNIAKEYLVLSFRLNNDVSLLPNNKMAIDKIFSKPFRIGLERDCTVSCKRPGIEFSTWKFYSCDKSMRICFYIPELKYEGLIRAKKYYVFSSLSGMVGFDVYIIINARKFNIGSVYFTELKNKRYKSGCLGNSFFSFFDNGKLLHEWNKKVREYNKNLYGRYSIGLKSFPAVYHRVPTQDVSMYNKLVSEVMDELEEVPQFRPMRVEIHRRGIETLNRRIPLLCFKDINSGWIMPKIHSLYQALSYCLSFSYGKTVECIRIASLIM